MVAEVMGRPLTPGQPPWEMHVIEGLAGGKVGLIAKVHHSVIDGVAGAQMLAQLLDLAPEGRAVTEPLPAVGARTAALADAAGDRRAAQLHQEPGAGACAPSARSATPPSGWPAAWSATRIGPVSIPLGAPATFESPVGARRAVAFAELDMAQVRVLKERFGSTINDVVLAVCSGALRTHLAAHGQDAESPLVAVVPVSVRGRRARRWARATSSRPCSCRSSNDRKTPLERLRTVTAASASCKGQERAVGYGPMATLLADAIPPALAKPVIQLGVRSGVMRKLRAGNLMISNVPGPAFPLYFAGMQLRGVYPLGPVVDGVALNVTVQSYRDSLFVGINACAAAVPDLPALARAMVDELALLCRMAVGCRASAGVRPGRATVLRGRPRHRAAVGPAPVGGHLGPAARRQACHRRRSLIRAIRRAACSGTGRVAPHGRVAPGWPGAAVGPGGRTRRGRAVAAEQGAGARASGRGGSSRSRRTTAPTTPRPTPTGAERRGRR